MNRDYSQYDLEARIAEYKAQRDAEIANAISGRVSVFQKVYCDLSTAQAGSNAYKISVPFRSVFVRTATDTQTKVYLSPNENSIGNIAEALPLQKNDSFDFGVTLRGAYLWWDEQPAKIMELYLSTLGAMRAGSQVSQFAGGISIVSGSSIDSGVLGSGGNQSSVTLTAPTAGVVLPVDADRKSATLYLTGPCWGGDPAVTAGSRGVLFPAGQVKVTNTGLLYMVPVSGTVTVTGNVEK